tara:strand:+ start:129 stop:905 length:777 start_codon:yes stop_codon:yes gene_type:complete
MPVQDRRIINDLGSAVVEEVVSQLNRAACYTPPQLALQHSSIAGADEIAFGESTFQQAEEITTALFVAAEDCLVTSLRLMTTHVLLDAGTAANTSMVLLRVPVTYTSGAGAAADQVFNTADGIHGNAAAVALGAAPATYALVAATDGTFFTAANGFDVGQWGELLGVASTGGAGAIGAADFDTSAIAANHAATAAVAFPDRIAMLAGDTLVLGVSAAADFGATDTSLLFSVGYRPMKDSITLQKNVPNKLRNWSVSAR